MKKILLALIAPLATASAMAQSDPLWMRFPAISPDGKTVAFSYKGDIWTVPANGGQARQITTNPAYDAYPVWSPDSRQIAFASSREGSMDIYVVGRDGGTPRRVTTDSGDEYPMAWRNDSTIMLKASIMPKATSIMFADFSQVYEVSDKGGRMRLFSDIPMEDISVGNDGALLYHDNKGYEDPFRKHHQSPICRDIWLYKGGNYTKLTNFAGEDRTPVWGGDNTYYYLSEEDGTFNVYKRRIGETAKTQLTHYKGNPVRFLTRSTDGTLCYAYDGAIYTLKEGSQPVRLNLSMVADDGSDKLRRQVLRSGATEFAVSPSGKEIAFVVHGDVYVTSTDYTTTKRISDTPEQERNVNFSPDGRSLVYASERGGLWQIYQTSIVNKDEKQFTYATQLKEEQLVKSSLVDMQPAYSPDGKSVAYIEDRGALKAVDVKTKAVRQLMDGKFQYSYSDGDLWFQWSPDSKWFCLEFIGNGRDPYSDIGIVSVNGGKITNITNSAYINVLPRWVLDGGAIMFISNRYGLRSQASWGSQDDVLLAFVNEEAFDRYRLNKEEMELLKETEKAEKAEKDKANKDKKDEKKSKSDKDEKDKVKDIVVELDKIKDRVIRVTLNSSDLAGCAINKDGDVLYYLSRVEKDYDLWKMDLRKNSTQLINKMNTKWADIQTDKDGKNFFILGGSSMHKMSGDKLTPITYSAVVKMNRAKEREYMFENVNREVARRFYNTNMHGCDWDATIKNYRKFLPHINNNYDFSYMLSEVLGELNASHTGSRYYPNGSAETTAQLGLFFDWNYTGKGLKVSEVVEYGPFDRAKSKVRPGTIITKINGTDITVENDYTTLLNGQVGKKVLVTCKNASGEWEEVVKPISAGMNNALLYKRWVKRQEALCDSLSGGRLGYVHLQQMNDNSYREIYEKVLGEYNKKDGIVIDTRFNGGGRLHEDIQILFSGEKYLTQVVRGREACDMPSRRWNRPTIMLQCEANYSNAHGTPWVYKHTGMGKLVGMPVPGTMTSVNWITMQDESLIFGIPIIGYRLADGSYLENQQLDPDIRVANDPAVIVTGRDQQLEAAVKELLQEIDAKK